MYNETRLAAIATMGAALTAKYGKVAWDADITTEEYIELLWLSFSQTQPHRSWSGRASHIPEVLYQAETLWRCRHHTIVVRNDWLAILNGIRQKLGLRPVNEQGWEILAVEEELRAST